MATPGGGLAEHRLVDAHGKPPGDDREQPHRRDHDHVEQRGIEEEQCDRHHEGDDGDRRAEDAGDPSPGQSDPSADRSQHQDRPGCDHPTGMIGDRDDDEHEDPDVREERDDCRGLPPARVTHRSRFRTRSWVANQPGMAGR